MPHCRVTLEGGFPLHRTSSESGVVAWVEGPPEKNVFGMLKTKGRRSFPMYAWRCPNCALVRLYAPEEES